MNESFEKYDSADYLHTEDDMLAYLNAAAEISDSQENITHALAVVARARARNMSQLARDAAISREGLYKALGQGGNPSLATVVQIARALGFRIAFTACH